MRKRFAVGIVLVSMTVVMSACGTAPCITVHRIHDIEKAVQAEKIVFIFDATNRNNRYFLEYFLDRFTQLTQDTPKQLSIMTGYEYARSPYSKPDTAETYNDILFIVVTVSRFERGKYNTRLMSYSMVIQYKDQDPLLVEELEQGIANPYLDSNNWRGDELAEVIYEELNKRNIL